MEKENHYKPTEKQAKYIEDIRANALETISEAHRIIKSTEDKKGLDNPVAKKLKFYVEKLQGQIERDETAIKGGDPTTWITISSDFLRNLQQQTVRFARY